MIIMDRPFFTIFTPVYNGQTHLERVFESINNQTFKNFEWIVVNDGSTDNSHDLITSFIDKHPEINITYIEQHNSGKHIAWNKAVEIAQGLLFIPADADDSFLPETLSFFHMHWIALSSREQEALSGINVLCFDNDSDNIVGPPYPMDGMKSNNLELEYKLKVTGEKWGCIRLDLLKLRPFPIVKGSYFPESYLWLHIAKHHQAIYFNEPLRRYYTTLTGITQKPISESSIEEAKVKVRSYSWFLINFGFYILVNSPRVFYVTIVCILFYSRVIVKRWLHIN